MAYVPDTSHMREFMSKYRPSDLTPEGSKDIDRLRKALDDYYKMPFFWRMFNSSQAVKIWNEIDSIFSWELIVKHREEKKKSLVTPIATS